MKFNGLLPLAALLVAGCTLRPTAVSAPVTLSGRAMLGPIAGDVWVHAVKSDGSAGALLATTTTDAGGNYAVSVVLPGTLPMPLLVLVAGTYLEEADGKSVRVPVLSPIGAVVPSVSSGRSATVAVTAITEVARQAFLHAVSGGVPAGMDEGAFLSQKAASANDVAAQAFGLEDPLGILPPDLGKGAAGESPESKAYSLLLAAISKQGAELGVSSFTVANAYAKDFTANDGTFTGNNLSVANEKGLLVQVQVNLGSLPGIADDIADSLGLVKPGFTVNFAPTVTHVVECDPVPTPTASVTLAIPAEAISGSTQKLLSDVTSTYGSDVVSVSSSGTLALGTGPAALDMKLPSWPGAPVTDLELRVRPVSTGPTSLDFLATVYSPSLKQLWVARFDAGSGATLFTQTEVDDYAVFHTYEDGAGLGDPMRLRARIALFSDTALSPLGGADAPLSLSSDKSGEQRFVDLTTSPAAAAVVNAFLPGGLTLAGAKTLSLVSLYPDPSETTPSIAGLSYFVPPFPATALTAAQILPLVSLGRLYVLSFDEASLVWRNSFVMPGGLPVTAAAIRTTSPGYGELLAYGDSGGGGAGKLVAFDYFSVKPTPDDVRVHAWGVTLGWKPNFASLCNNVVKSENGLLPYQLSPIVGARPLQAPGTVPGSIDDWLTPGI